jgi:hypothetical protein
VGAFLRNQEEAVVLGVQIPEEVVCHGVQILEEEVLVVRIPGEVGHQ